LEKDESFLAVFISESSQLGTNLWRLKNNKLFVSRVLTMIGREESLISPCKREEGEGKREYGNLRYRVAAPDINFSLSQPS
jgi:hypothetical protein